MKPFIIIKHGYTACQHHDCQHTAKPGKYTDRTSLAHSRCFMLVHFLSEIPDRPVIGLAFFPQDIFPCDHIILHHLVALIVNTVSTQLVKTIGRGNINSFFPVQSTV